MMLPKRRAGQISSIIFCGETGNGVLVLPVINPGGLKTGWSDRPICAAFDQFRERRNAMVVGGSIFGWNVCNTLLEWIEMKALSRRKVLTAGAAGGLLAAATTVARAADQVPRPSRGAGRVAILHPRARPHGGICVIGSGPYLRLSTWVMFPMPWGTMSRTPEMSRCVFSKCSRAVTMPISHSING